MNKDDLLSLLYVHQVHPEELLQIALATFGAGAYKSENEFVCHRLGEPPALHFVFKESELQTVKPGDGLLNEDISKIQDKIRTDLLDLTRKIVGRMILFSFYPVAGHIRVGEFIQICPVPIHAPRPNDPTEGDHPFLIEFEVFDSPNLSIRINRIYSHAQRLSLFLGVIAEGLVMLPNTSSHFRWVTRNDPKSQYEHLLEGYGYSEFQRQQDFFTECNDMPLLELVEDKQYFARMGCEIGRPLQLPKSFHQLINIFRNLDPPRQNKFLRAAYWYSLAQMQESSSARFLHLIQAIETLVPPADVREECPACKRELIGPTKRFIELLDRLVPAHSELSRARKQFYKFRSDLSHGRDICGRDLGVNHVPKSADQTMLVFEAYQLARLALINWLNGQAPQSEASNKADAGPDCVT